MNSLKRLFLSAGGHLPYLMRSSINAKKKVSVLLHYIKISIKLLILSRLFRLKRERIHGFLLAAFDYEAIDFLYKEIFFKNDYFFTSRKSKPIIIDCGANIGAATLYFKWLFPQCEVHAFEPDANAFSLLKKNVKQNKLSGVHLYNAALADNRGRIPFYADARVPGSLTMSACFSRGEKARVMVDSIALSSFINENLGNRQIDFLKLDIEGGESMVIQDLAAHGKLNHVRELVIEYHHQYQENTPKLASFLRLLEDAGFSYNLDARQVPLASTGPENIMIHAYRTS